MQAETLIQVDSLMHVIIAPLAAALITVDKSKWRAIVASGNDALIFGNDGSVAPLHAVRARRRKLGQPHEVSVEGRSDQLRVPEVVLGKHLMEVKQVVCLVLEALPDEVLLL